MTKRWWQWGRSGSEERDDVAKGCPLAACDRGCRAAVLRMECSGAEAYRLRSLGLYEGSCVLVVDRQDGYLLDVAGSRLAVGAHLARAITVRPLGG